MTTILPLIGFFAFVLVVFFVIYWFVHHKLSFVDLGRTVATIVMLAGTALDQFGALPWGTILSTTQAAIVSFGIIVAQNSIHLYQQYQASTATPTPPAA